jgi:8-oxo-dGTP pyrophosphatase MutT (NUDIX family)
MRDQPSIEIACGAICEQEGRILMVREYRQDEGHVLNQPVGGLELGESILDAAIREVREETGLEIELTHFLGAYVWLINDGKTSIRFCFVARVIGGNLRPEPRTDSETVKPVWLSLQQLKESEPKFRNPVTKKCLEDYFAGVRHPLSVIQALSGPTYLGD